MASATSILWISGTVGVGKTVIAEAMSEILKEQRIPHAFIDRDALSNSWPPQGPFNEEVVQKNLEAVWRNFKEAGAERMIVAGVIENQADLDRYRSTLGGELVLVRIKASRKTREARLKARTEGRSLEWHLYRTNELEAILDQAPLATLVAADSPIRFPTSVTLHSRVKSSN